MTTRNTNSIDSRSTGTLSIWQRLLVVLGVCWGWLRGLMGGGSGDGQARRPLTEKERKRLMWRSVRRQLPPMSGRQWVRFRKGMQRITKQQAQWRHTQLQGAR